MKNKIIKKLILTFCLAIAVLLAAGLAMAAGPEVGLEYAAETGLSAADPRVMIANIIRIALGFLGIIAVGLIIYAGWIWMTAAGEQEKIEKAKKILTGAAIGLLICLSSFAIASFILSRLIGATTVGGDGSVCDPPCGSGQYCCASSCSSTPCGGSYGGDDSYLFKISSTRPHDQETDVARNAVIKTFFNKAISDLVDQAVLANNFKVEKTAEINPETEAETALAAPQSIMGELEITDGRMVINFKGSDNCGDAPGTLNCLPPYSKFKVTVNGSSGIVSVNNQSLSCSASIPCEFVFSTGNSVDSKPPSSGIISTQMCQDDGSLKADANTAYGWGRDDVGISALSFKQRKLGEATDQQAGLPIVGNGQTYQTTSFKYDTSAMAVGEKYIFSIYAYDVANHSASSSFSAVIRPGHCCNGIKDASETDTDCGGDCGACDGGACAADMSLPLSCSDNLCASQFCTAQNSNQASCSAAGYDDQDSCCLCRRQPVIMGVFPTGGFCANDINKACLVDGDCSGGAKCDMEKPNGAAGNFVTISGKYFGSSRGKVYFSGASADSFVEAKLADDPVLGNAICASGVWSDTQIIAVVPNGANAGPIKVLAASGFSDDSKENPFVPDFVANTISRPGLCKLDPAHGKMNDTINYYGIKLNGTNAYFGNWQNKISALNSAVNNDKQASAKVPNLISGLTDSFVSNAANKVYSNYLSFYKDAEPYTGPAIISFNPVQGRAGQYVTIRGSGFGRIKGTSKVFFGATEAGYDFPEVCQDSVWSDNQVIVKVPDGLANGDYTIKMEVGTYTLDTGKISPDKFKVDSNLPLAPNLCKINPSQGQINSDVNIYGENFGAKDTALIRFQANKDQTAGGISFWGKEKTADKASTKVPNGAVSGEVKILQNSLASNPLNFLVGSCSKDDDCGSAAVCCPENSPFKGKCAPYEKDSQGKIIESSVPGLCFSKIKASVYEWNFTTGDYLCKPQDMCGGTCCAGGTCVNNACSCPTASPNKCSDGCCSAACDKTGKCPVAPPESCAGYGNQCFESYFCPNSPGKCSANNGGQEDTGVRCGDQACEDLDRCLDDSGNNICSYSAALNKCKKISETCNLNKTKETSGVVDAAGNKVELKCGRVDGKSVWYYDSKQSCASGYVKNIDGSKCLGAVCAACGSGFACVSEDSVGVCATDKTICPAGSSCSNNKCVNQIKASCQCCCDKTKNTASGNPDCCPGLTCDNSCGSGGNFGLCTGCTVAGNQAASNAKCNCSGTSGKYCNTDGAGGLGTCEDCASISGLEECNNKGIGVCCVDAQYNGCRGGVGKSGSDIIYSGANYSYCAYYKCADNSNACSGQAVASSTSMVYKTYEECSTKCSNITLPGLACVKEDGATNKEICDSSICTDLTCLNADGTPASPSACGTCCCDPANDNCASLNPGKPLKCQPDKGNCTGSGRGLCCGCSSDSDCGNANLVGCGSDTCCQARPTVIDMAPFGNNICRNSLIQATFNMPMQISSFNGNIIVAGDYGINTCPAGTNYLTAVYKPSIFAKIKFWLSKLPLINKLFASQALAENVSGNFCAITGTVSGRLIDSGSKTLLEFAPNIALEANKTYYVIIKGDSNTADKIKEGVLSQTGISLRPVDEKTFNGVTYKGKIWYFATKASNSNDSGICQISYIKIAPYSYLFNSAVNDPADDADISKDAIIKDSDKIFMASAYSADSQPIVVTDIYNWRWDWSIENQNVVKFKNNNAAENNKEQTIVAQNVKEDSTLLHAKATVVTDKISKTPTVGTARENVAPVYVFLCANPWPAFKNDALGNLVWEPWQDTSGNCTVAGGNCYNTNYELYYCRDAGGAGTADDLPAILSDQAVVRPYSADQDILKEFYFFREGLPSAAGGLSVSALPEGGKVMARWNPVSGAAGYKIYFGMASGKYSDSVDAKNSNQYEVSGLINNRIYYFAMTSYNSKGAESDYSNEVSAVPADTQGPLSPEISALKVNGNKVEVGWKDSSGGDAVRFKLFYGADNNFGASVNVDYNAYGTTTVSNLAGGVTYYFGLVAYDADGNPSATTTDSIRL